MISKDFLRTNKFSKDSKVSFYVDKIIDYISIKEYNHKFYIDDIAKSIDVPQYDETDFVCAVFYLTRPNVRIFKQCFEVFENKSHTEIDNIDLVVDCLRDSVYYHPFTREEMSPDDFANTVLTYFVRLI